MRHSCLFLLVLTLGISPVAFAEDSAASSAEAVVDLHDLQKAIPHGISLLEKKDYQTFLKTFVEPEQLARATNGATLEKFAAEFGESKAGALLEVMKATRGTQPKTEQNGDVVVYSIPENVAKAANISRRELAFVRIEKRWYIRN